MKREKASHYEPITRVENPVQRIENMREEQATRRKRAERLRVTGIILTVSGSIAYATIESINQALNYDGLELISRGVLVGATLGLLGFVVSMIENLNADAKELDVFTDALQQTLDKETTIIEGAATEVKKDEIKLFN